MAIRKVAVTTWWHYHNYGSALQATATVNALKKLGHKADLVNYIPSGKQYPTTPEADREHQENWANNPRFVDDSREKAFEEFTAKHFTLTEKVQEDEEFALLNDTYDVFVTGSDQIWAPRVFDERYFLDYVIDNRKKIAYAPSIGLPFIDNEFVKDRMRDLLSRFGHISVREEQGASLIENELGIDRVEVVPDPTLLLDYQDWRKLIPKSEEQLNDKYILCYFLGENENVWKHVNKIAQITGWKVKIIPVLQKDSQYGEIVEGVGPAEFFNLIDNASIVLTDSFHGSIFSIITNAPFYSFERFNPESRGSQNSRIYNLLDKTQLTERLIGFNEDDNREYGFDIDLKESQKIIKREKNKAIAWLDDALNEAAKVDEIKSEALITYYAHSLEKSLSNPVFEQGRAFGVVKDLVDLLQKYLEEDFNKESPAYTGALSALEEFNLRHKGSKYQGEVERIIGPVLNEAIDNRNKNGGSLVISNSDKKDNASKNFKDLAMSRYSTRNYLDKAVSEDDIKEAIEIAQKSPSACNRQQARVYYMTDKKIIDRVLEIQGTITNYPTPPLLFLVTATDDAYLFDTENNNGYIDGSLFAMSLLYALEYKGIGACPLHTMFSDVTRLEIMNLLGIPESEKLVFFISAGYFDEETLVCKSFRYESDYITHKVTQPTYGLNVQNTAKKPLTPEQLEIENIKSENIRLNNELASHLGFKRSAKLTVGNLKRHYSRGPLGVLKRKRRIRTRTKSLFASLRFLPNQMYWRIKDISINRKLKAISYRKLDENDKIPKVIHYIWVGGSKKPESVEKYINTWKKFCPDYEIIEWNEKNYNIKSNRYMREAYKAKKWAFVTDYIRLDILDRFGGIYMDTDIEVLKNMDKFLVDSAFSSFEAGDPHQIFLPTGMMGSEKSGEWVKFLKSYYSPERSFYHENGEMNMTTNTATITGMTVERYNIKLNNKLQKFDDFTIYPSEYFCPKSWSTRKINLTKNTHAIHHFAATWLPLETKELQHKGENVL